MAPVSGTVALDGLSAPVRIVHDRWGVPHIFARTTADLFAAQGFVQGADRLFQMDLWRRSVQGRLAEVLGPNFIGRDAMTRRVQYRGDMDREWAGYGPDTKAIAAAFVRGINAWVAIARERPPEEFALAGWLPERWRPEDLLNRTDAFAASAGAIEEVFRARLMTAVGSARAAALLGERTARLPDDPDPSVVTYAVADALRQVGAAPFFASLASLPSGPPKADTTYESARGAAGSNAWVVSPRRSATGAPLLATDPHRALANPSVWYLVHLSAPGWNVIGATAPWLPGVAIGHNDRIAWGMTSFDADVQDLYVERLNPANHHQIDDRGRWIDTTVAQESLWVKGRARPLTVDREYTPHGVVVAVDTEKHLAFVLRWSGMEPGTGGALAALDLDRAGSAAEVRAALARWKMPAADVVYADRDGTIGSQAAALVPTRSGWNGAAPAAGWTGTFEWKGWQTPDDLPHAVNPPSGYLALANHSVARIERLRQAFAVTRPLSRDDFQMLQHDVLAWNAVRLLPLLARVTSERQDVEEGRRLLLKWDRLFTTDSAAATLYAIWERQAARMLAERRVGGDLGDELATRLRGRLVDLLIHPSSVWFDGEVTVARDRLVLQALAAALDDLRLRAGEAVSSWTWGRFHTTGFSHPLAITEGARRRFAVGPFARPGYADTVMSSSGAALEATTGASFSAVFDVSAWDESRALNAPGQSGSPASPHFADLASLWASGGSFPLVFSEAAIEAAAESTLTLVPRSTGSTETRR